MELRQLRYLISLEEEGSFTRAAEASNVAQPALSRQIQKLERELGLPLVDRTTRRISLTPAGQETVAAGRRALGELDGLSHSLQQTMKLLRGTVTIGITQTAGPVDVPKLLAGFCRQHPGVDLVVREGLSVDLAAQLRQDRLDLAIVSAIDVAERSQLELKACRAERLVASVPANHRLASRKTIKLSDLENERFVSFPHGATIRRTVEQAAKANGFLPLASLETHDVSRMLALVGEGLGVALLPESDARRGGPRAVVVPISDPSLRYEVFVAWRARRHLSPAAGVLRDGILDQDMLVVGSHGDAVVL